MGIEEIRTGGMQKVTGQYDNEPVENGENNQEEVVVIQVKVENTGVGTEVQKQAFNPFDAGVDKVALQKSLGKSSGLVAADTLADTLETLSNKYTEIQTKLTRLRRDMSKSPEIRFLAEECLADLGAIDFKKGYPVPANKGNKNVKMMSFNNEVRNYEQKCLAKMETLIKDYDLETILSEMKMHAGQVIGTTIGMGEAAMANDNANAALIMANDNANAGAVLAQGVETQKAVHQEGQTTRKAVHAEGQATRNAVHIEEAITRNVVRQEGVMTRNTVRDEGAITRNLVRDESEHIRGTVENEGARTRATVRETTHDTQVLGELSDEINVLLEGSHLKDAKAGISSVRDKIIASNLPQEEKETLLRDLADFVQDQTLISAEDIADRNKIVTTAIRNNDRSDKITGEQTTQDSTGTYREVPEHEVPYYENPFPNRPHAEPAPNTSKDAGKTKEAGPTKEKDTGITKEPDSVAPADPKITEKTDKKKGKKV